MHTFEKVCTRLPPDVQRAFMEEKHLNVMEEESIFHGNKNSKEPEFYIMHNNFKSHF
jgi:hypothetical protein